MMIDISEMFTAAPIWIVVVLAILRKTPEPLTHRPKERKGGDYDSASGGVGIPSENVCSHRWAFLEGVADGGNVVREHFQTSRFAPGADEFKPCRLYRWQVEVF